jgi:hypothetical protein
MGDHRSDYPHLLPLFSWRLHACTAENEARSASASISQSAYHLGHCSSRAHELTVLSTVARHPPPESRLCQRLSPICEPILLLSSTASTCRSLRLQLQPRTSISDGWHVRTTASSIQRARICSSLLGSEQNRPRSALRSSCWSSSRHDHCDCACCAPGSPSSAIGQ